MSFPGITRGINAAQDLLDTILGTGGPGSGLTGGLADLLQNIQPASFRGVPFAVLVGESRFGRRIALHEYPFRDDPWPEDVGRGTRKFSIQGFIITDSLIYGGGDVQSQRDQLVAAAESAGAGTLIHPTLGRLQVTIPEDGLIITERLDASNYMEFTLACYESGERKFPAGSQSAGDDSLGAADDLDSASAFDFIDSVQDAVSLGGFVVQMAVQTVTSWVEILNVCAQDATGIFNLAADLPGDFGRYFNGALAGYAQALVGPAVPLTLENLIFSASQARATVANKGVDLIAAAATQEPTGPPAAAAAACAALVAAVVNPADGVRLFPQLVNFYPDAPTGISQIGEARAIMQDAMAALLRRAALSSLVRVTETYQPQSEDDANAVRVTVCQLLDAEAVVAGDSGNDRTFLALTQARGLVAADMGGRGAQLPPMRLFSFAETSASLVLAQRIYQDSTRADQLVSEAQPRHPSFMPLQFKALSS